MKNKSYVGLTSHVGDNISYVMYVGLSKPYVGLIISYVGGNISYAGLSISYVGLSISYVEIISPT